MDIPIINIHIIPSLQLGTVALASWLVSRVCRVSVGCRVSVSVSVRVRAGPSYELGSTRTRPRVTGRQHSCGRDVCPSVSLSAVTRRN